MLEAGADVQRSAVVVNGQTPGPLITGHVGDTVQVCQPTLLWGLEAEVLCEQIKVIDELTDDTMAQGTSIVSVIFRQQSEDF